MEDKMKVWECTGCKSGGEDPCMCFTESNCPNPTNCLFMPADASECSWHETTRYEITERKPTSK